MGYDICAIGGNELPIASREASPQRSKNKFDGKFVTVRDGDGNINLDFYYARARKERSKAAHSLFRSLFSTMFGSDG